MFRLAAVLIMLALILPAFAQHLHPPQDAAIHERFYSTWMMPNAGKPRQYGCCNKQDCYPAEIKEEGGNYFARTRDGRRWIPIPPSKLEDLQPDPRESPDGRSHVCMPLTEAGVYCAVRGSAI